MTPGELAAVWASWSELRPRRAVLVPALERRYEELGIPGARERALWLTAAVDELVDHLGCPSRLGARARELAESWVDPSSGPSFAVDGRAWLAAARDCSAQWTAHVERAWRQGWFLLSEELDADALSPFGVTRRS